MVDTTKTGTSLSKAVSNNQLIVEEMASLLYGLSQSLLEVRRRLAEHSSVQKTFCTACDDYGGDWETLVAAALEYRKALSPPPPEPRSLEPLLRDIVQRLVPRKESGHR